MCHCDDNLLGAVSAPTQHAPAHHTTTQHVHTPHLKTHHAPTPQLTTRHAPNPERTTQHAPNPKLTTQHAPNPKLTRNNPHKSGYSFQQTKFGQIHQSLAAEHHTGPALSNNSITQVD